MKYNFTAARDCLISQLVFENIIGLKKSAFRTLLKLGEIRLNGVKQFFDIEINKGDKVAIFVPKKFLANAGAVAGQAKIIYSDDNILIVNKPQGLDTENNLTAIIKADYPDAEPAHRLDRNTAGLIVFGLNRQSLDALLHAFKNSLIEKYYYALVTGKFKADGKHTAYLAKDSEKGLVYIYAAEKKGSKKIISQFRFISLYGNNSLIEAQPITGRTHQLRAHLKFLGYPIVGDGKYSDKNSSEKTGFQKLAAYKLVFGNLNAPLHNLRGQTFKIEVNLID